jgi:hypothetical protein
MEKAAPKKQNKVKFELKDKYLKTLSEYTLIKFEKMQQNQTLSYKQTISSCVFPNVRKIDKSKLKINQPSNKGDNMTEWQLKKL